MSDTTLALPFDDERDGYAISPAANTDWEEAMLGGMHLWIRQNRMTNLARFEPKITFGDNTAASDALMSTWNQRDWTGGMLYGELNEGSDTERYRYGTAETRYPRQLCQNAETIAFAFGDHDISGPLGDIVTGASRWLLAHFDTALARFDPTTQAFVAGPNLTAVPVGKGVTYRGNFYIPLGSNGYASWDGVAGAVTPGTTGITPVSFTLWDDRLCALEHDGQLNFYDGTTWVTDPNWLARMKLPEDHIPRHVITWWAPNREQTLFIITNERVFSYDAVAQILYPTGLKYPRHPDQGLAANSWRDDNLYVSVAMGVHQMTTGQVISAMGLDRGDGTGLPIDLVGRIVDFEPEYNGLIAVVSGQREELGPPPTLTGLLTLEESQAYEEPVVFGPLPVDTPPTEAPHSRAGSRSALFRYNGFGWHPVWEANENIGVPTQAVVSHAQGTYDLWWGYGGRLYRQQLRRGFHNPREGAKAKIDRFEQRSYLFTGRFDAMMSGFDKSADLLEIVTLPEHFGTIDAYYTTDKLPRTYLGQASAPDSRTILPFDRDRDLFPEGEPFRWIEFEYQLSSPERWQTCLMDSAILRFLKVPITTYSFSFDVFFRDNDPGMFGYSPQESLQRLNDMATSWQFVLFKHRKKSYRVRVAQVSADLRSGQDMRNVASISLVQATYDKAPW